MSCKVEQQGPCQSTPLLEVKDLKKWFPVGGSMFGSDSRYVKAVDGISFSLFHGETLGIVGESGSGKSTMARTIIRLFEATAGEVFFENVNILKLPTEKMRLLRRNFQMVFQDPYASLNPRMKVSEAIAEPMIIHDLPNRKARVAELLELVGIRPERGNSYPHQFSGGQRQRIGIARALAASPKLIVFDEPVSALDVSIQAQILNLIKDLQQQLQLTYLFITHDLSVVSHISTAIGVMYLGNLVEIAPKEEIFKNPLHPYTKALLSAIPTSNPKIKKERILLTGEIPSPLNPPTGCKFHTRCPLAREACKTTIPQMKEYEDRHFSACNLLDQM